MLQTSCYLASLHIHQSQDQFSLGQKWSKFSHSCKVLCWGDTQHRGEHKTGNTTCKFGLWDSHQSWGKHPACSPDTFSAPFLFFFFFGITQSTSPTCSLWVPTILWNKWCLKKVPPKQFPAVGFPHSLPPEIFVSYQRTGLKKCITEKFTLENASKILPWTHSSPSMSVLLWRAQKWTQDLRCGLISAQHRWQPLPWFCWPHYSCSRPGALGLLGHQHPQLLFL